MLKLEVLMQCPVSYLTVIAIYELNALIDHSTYKLQMPCVSPTYTLKIDKYLEIPYLRTLKDYFFKT